MSAATEDTPVNTVDITLSPPRPLSPIEEHGDLDGASAVAKSDHGNNDDHASVTFHPDWDAVIKLKGKSGVIQFKVVSGNIAAASPVWRSAMYGDSGKPQIRPGKENLVLKVEDNAKALETLLRIIHYDFAKVPKNLSLDDVYEITRLTSKYQCTRLVYPWASKWVGLLETYLQNADCPFGNYKAAWIAWELGSVKLFKDMMDSLIVTTNVDKDGEVVNKAGLKLKDLILPSGFLDRIVAIRAKTIEAMLSTIQKPISHFFKKKEDRDPTIRYCKLGTDGEHCFTMMVGSALQQLIQAGLYPVPGTNDYKESICALKDHVFAIEYKHWEGRDYVPHKSHHRCDLGFKDSVLEVLRNMSLPLQDADLAHMDQQSVISGVENGNELAAFRSTLRPTAAEFKVSSKSEPDQSSVVVKVESVGECDMDEVKKENGVQDETESANGFDAGIDSHNGVVSIKEEKVGEES